MSHHVGEHAGCDVTHRLSHRRGAGQRRSLTGSRALEHADSDGSASKLEAVAKNEVLLREQRAETLSRSWSLTTFGKNERKERSLRTVLFLGHLPVGYLLQWLQVQSKPKVL